MSSQAVHLFDHPINSLITGGHDYHVQSAKQIYMVSNRTTIENAEVTLRNDTEFTLVFQYLRNHIKRLIENGFETSVSSRLVTNLLVNTKPEQAYRFTDSGQKSAIQYLGAGAHILHEYRTTINLVNFLHEGETKSCSGAIFLIAIGTLMGLLQWVL